MKYKVICKECKHSDNVFINEDNEVMWGKNTYIISARHRLDGQWGWQCFCGNNTLLSKQETDTITNPQTPDPVEIKQVIDNLQIEKQTSFIMEKI